MPRRPRLGRQSQVWPYQPSGAPPYCSRYKARRRTTLCSNKSISAAVAATTSVVKAGDTVLLAVPSPPPSGPGILASSSTTTYCGSPHPHTARQRPRLRPPSNGFRPLGARPSPHHVLSSASPRALQQLADVFGGLDGSLWCCHTCWIRCVIWSRCLADFLGC